MAKDGECLLSILIPTLESRRELCAEIQQELERQLAETGTPEAVEIVLDRDDGSAAVGAKRNRLISRSRGRFVVFVDDDDRLSPDYVGTILAAIRDNDSADCICFPGEIRFRGRHPAKLVHSIRFRDWSCSGGEYRRPPCHIMPIRRDIASRYAFAEVDFAEDMDWALRMSHDRALRQEVLLDEVLYYYQCRRFYAVQWLLDRSQPLRHALGLRFADGNKLRKSPAWSDRRAK